MNRTFSTGDDVDAALNFLGRSSRPPVSGDEFFKLKIDTLINDIMKAADESRFNLIKELMNESNKGDSISKLRELLGTK